MAVIDWLLDGDPAVRWQVLRDLVDAPDDVVAAERSRVCVDGWGAALLARRDPDGQWAGGACFPAGFRFDRAPDQAADQGQPWTATLPTLDLLRVFGLDPAARQARETVRLVAANCRWEHAGQRYFDGEVEACINGRTVAAGAYFGADVSGIVERLTAESLADGGWNCWTEHGSVRSSFHSTINVLEGLLEYERAGFGDDRVRAARRGGEQYLLERGLFRRRRTCEVALEAFRRFSFPVHWHYDVLRALDYFRSTGDPPDPRIADALRLVRDRRRPDGTWLLENTHLGAMHVALEDGDGRASRWITLRALRVLRWADHR